jgi:hypothetical protein
MKTSFVALLVALASGPLVARAKDGPTALPRAPYRLDTPSLVLTQQGVQRQALTPISSNPSTPQSDVGQRGWSPARSTLLDLVNAAACTSMFAMRPDTQGTDPAASAGR